MFVKIFFDGIGFYQSKELFETVGEDSEIAFYSRISKNIRYSLENLPENEYGISVEDNQFILDKVKEYINRKDKVVTKDGLYFTVPTG